MTKECFETDGRNLDRSPWEAVPLAIEGSKKCDPKASISQSIQYPVACSHKEKEQEIEERALR